MANQNAPRDDNRVTTLLGVDDVTGETRPFLVDNATGRLLITGTVVGGGDVVGPASSTDNAVARFDGATGKLLQNSTVTMGDNGLMAWTGTGQAITAASYQIGRDADATNQLHFNVPTGASMEWSVNDAAAMVLSSGGAIIIPNGLAVGTSNSPVTTMDVRGNMFCRSTDPSASMTNEVSSLVKTEFNAFPAGATNTEYRGYMVDVYTSGALGNITSPVSAFRGMVRIEANHTFTQVNGALYVVDLDVGTITESSGLRTLQDYTGGAVGTSFGIYIPAIVGSVAPTTSYALKLDAPGLGATQWTMYSTSGNNAFGGNTRFGGVTAPTVAVDVTGAVRVTTSLILEETGAGTDTITIQAPSSIAASYTLTLPDTDGDADQFLKTDGSGVLSWSAVSGTGDFVGPASSTDNAVVRFNGTTGKLGQNSNVIIDDSSNVTINQAVITSGSPTGFTFTGGAHTTLAAETFAPDIYINLNRTVQWATGDLEFQPAILISSPELSFVGASSVEFAATILIDGVPRAGTNATVQSAASLSLGDSSNTNTNTGRTTLLEVSRLGIANGVGAVSGIHQIYYGGGETSLGNQTATLTDASVIYINSPEYVSTTNTRTVTNPYTVSIGGAPIAGSNVTFTNTAMALYIQSGATRLGGNVGIGTNPTTNLVNMSQSAASTGAPRILYLQGGSHTTLTAGSELIDVLFSLDRTVQWATGAIATNRSFLVNAPTLSFVGASTVTTAATFVISGAPSTGSNATILRSSAFQIGGNTTLATTSDLKYQAVSIPTHTLTLTGTTQVTSASIAGIGIEQITITDSSAVTVNNAASLYIVNAPVAAGSVTLTDSYAVWIDAGSSRFDGRVLEAQGADVASANDMTLGNDGNTFEITGTTTINTIVTTGWTLGSLVTLIFTSTPTVKHNVAGGASTAVILLAGAADFSATAGDTLTLRYSDQGGTFAWREVGRAII